MKTRAVHFFDAFSGKGNLRPVDAAGEYTVAFKLRYYMQLYKAKLLSDREVGNNQMVGVSVISASNIIGILFIKINNMYPIQISV